MKTTEELAEMRERRLVRERAERLMASAEFQAAGERFNREYYREIEEARENGWFDPTQPFCFRR